MDDRDVDGVGARRAGAGRTVRLFLTDGSPHGVVVADVGNWNGKALAAPRGRLSDLLRRPEAARTGVYILLGPDPDKPDGLLAYVGEADDIAARLRIHLRSETKDFFDRVVFLVSSDEALTKGHVRYIESRLIRLTQEAGSVALTNDTHPDFQRLPEADRADMDNFVENAALVPPVLGCDLFRQKARPASVTHASQSSDNLESPIFTFVTAGAAATGQETEDGFVVLAGSTTRRMPSGTFPAGYGALRDRLLASGQLINGPSPDQAWFATDTMGKDRSMSFRDLKRAADGLYEVPIKQRALVTHCIEDGSLSVELLPERARLYYDMLDELYANAIKYGPSQRARVRIAVFEQDGRKSLLFSSPAKNGERRDWEIEGESYQNASDTIFGERSSGLRKIAAIAATLSSAPVRIRAHLRKRSFHLEVPFTG